MTIRLQKQIDLKGIEANRLIHCLMQEDLGQLFFWRGKNSSVLRVGIDFHPKQDAQLEDDFFYYTMREFEDSAKPSTVYIPKIIINFIESKAHIIAQDADEAHFTKVITCLTNLRLNTPKESIIESIHAKEISNPKDSLEEWDQTFHGAKKLIENKTLEKIVISRTKEYNHNLKNLNQLSLWKPIYESIENPNQYFILLKRVDGSIHFSMTPETLISREGQNVFIDSLAGTRKVSEDEEENKHIQKELLNNKKENYEHSLVEKYIESVLNSLGIQWIKNIPKKVKRLKYVQHLHSQYRGQVNLEQWEELRSSLHPTPAVGARPYQYWTKILDIEPRRRGLYSGLIGWHGDKREDICVNLRCMDITKDSLKIHAGCGIVEQSEVHHEYIETERKLFNFSQHLSTSTQESKSWTSKNL
jgi:isochorismate synthase EntC